MPVDRKDRSNLRLHSGETSKQSHKIVGFISISIAFSSYNSDPTTCFTQMGFVVVVIEKNCHDNTEKKSRLVHTPTMSFRSQVHSAGLFWLSTMGKFQPQSVYDHKRKTVIKRAVAMVQVEDEAEWRKVDSHHNFYDVEWSKVWEFDRRQETKTIVQRIQRH